LTKLVHEHGASAWAFIVPKLEGGRRNNQQCCYRWRYLDPSLTTGTFSAVEDASLTNLVHKHGASAWTLVASWRQQQQQKQQFHQQQSSLLPLQGNAGSFSRKAAPSSSNPPPLSDLIRTKPITTWTLADILPWLTSLSLQQYAQKFAENEIFGIIFLDLGLDDLDYLGIRVLAHRKRLLKGV
jgi:hypothetical protein